MLVQVVDKYLDDFTADCSNLKTYLEFCFGRIVSKFQIGIDLTWSVIGVLDEIY